MKNSLLYLKDFFLYQPLEKSLYPTSEMVVALMQESAGVDNGASFFWLMEYAWRTPAYVSESVKQVLGYHPSVFMHNPMADYLRLIPREDRKYLVRIFQDIAEFYQQIPLGEKDLYRFDFNYRIQRSDERFISVMQQTLFLETSESGAPLLEMSIVTDFNTYKLNPQLQLRIFKLQDGAYLQVGSCQYNEQLEKLSDREQEVIQLIAQGLTDKEIADRIFVSIHTVKTHRKHILQKMHCRNTAEALNKYLTTD